MSELTIEQRARIAGARGRRAEPMEPVRRDRAYLAQTGKPELTPRQRRRANKKLIGWLIRAAVSS